MAASWATHKSPHLNVERGRDLPRKKNSTLRTDRPREKKHGAPPSAVVADSIRYSVDASNQPVLFARTRGAPDQEMWSANAWAALVATLGLGDVACASTKAAVRAFVFGVAESIGVARAA